MGLTKKIVFQKWSLKHQQLSKKDRQGKHLEQRETVALRPGNNGNVFFYRKPEAEKEIG